MNKRGNIIVITIIILVIILGFWINGTIPKKIAKSFATDYLKKNFQQMQLEYIDIEWSPSFGGYLIKFKDEKNNTFGFIMHNKYFPTSLGQGIFELENAYRIEYEGISDINDFYNNSIVSGYDPIMTLPEDYSKEIAQKDNCFIIGAMVHNDNLYNQFMNNYNKKENAFIRVVQSTIEGDIFIIDVLYESKNNKIHLVKDDTRDKFSSNDDRTIKYKVYEKTGVWNFQNSQYWVAYNGELPNETIIEYTDNFDELFIIATIN